MKKVQKLVTLTLLALFIITSITIMGCESRKTSTTTVSRDEEVSKEMARSEIESPGGALPAPAPPLTDNFAEATKTAEPVKPAEGYVGKTKVAEKPGVPTVGDVPPPEQVGADIAKPGETVKPKIIYRADVKVRVGNLEEGIAKLREFTDQYKGRILDVRSHYREGEEGYGEAYITIKVPYDKVQEFVSVLGSLGKVENSQMTSEDVTMQWFDIQKDIERRKIELDQKYYEFKLSPTPSNKQIYLQLYNQYLDQSKKAAQLAYEADMSTVTVTLVTYSDLWMSALNIGLKILYYILIVVLVLLPCAILTLLIIWFIRWIIRLRKPKKV